MTRLNGKGSGSGTTILIVVLVLLVLFFLAYFIYLKPNGMLNLGF
jgi:hypothetical protein